MRFGCTETIQGPNGRQDLIGKTPSKPDSTSKEFLLALRRRKLNLEATVRHAGNVPRGFDVVAGDRVDRFNNHDVVLLRNGDRGNEPVDPPGTAVKPPAWIRPGPVDYK